MKIVEQGNRRLTVVTNNGTKLVCKPVRQLPLQDLLFKLGLTGRMLRDGSSEDFQSELSKASTEHQVDTARHALAVFNYTMAYGIETEPPDAAVEELRAMGLLTQSPNANKAIWLNYLVLEDSDEAGLLAGVIMALTFRGDDLANLDSMES